MIADGASGQEEGAGDLIEVRPALSGSKNLPLSLGQRAHAIAEGGRGEGRIYDPLALRCPTNSQRELLGRRVQIDSSHGAMVSHPGAVTDLILSAIHGDD